MNQTAPVEQTVPRFAFGKNWTTFIDRHFTEERVQIAQDHLLAFLRLESLSGKRMIDIGCGSGLQALAAVRANVDELICFDYDESSVTATRRLQARFGGQAAWRVEQGSILDPAYVRALGQFDIVYSWGVLHHTGDQWAAIRNAASLIAPGGVFYVALYTSDAFVDPPPEYWLDIKRQYNRGGWLVKRKLETRYAYNHLRGVYRSGQNPLAFVLRYKQSRGMSYFTGVRDWVGGWPMEFSAIQDVKNLGAELGLELINIATGQANTEYLFQRPGH